MTAKGTIQPDHIAINNYEFLVAGIPIKLVVTEIKGIEEELETVDLPDRTVATGGNSKSVSFDVTTPMHHVPEQVWWEKWFQEGKVPVSPGYKKVGTMQYNRESKKPGRSFTVQGAFVHKRKLPDGKMDDPGNMATVVWSLKADSILPI